MKHKNIDDLFEEVLKTFGKDGRINFDSVSSQDMENVLRAFLDKIGYKGVDPAEFMGRMRISFPVDYDVWFDFLKGYLDWDIYEVYENPGLLKPFGMAKTNQGTEVALYATSASHSPGDVDDKVVNDMLRSIAGIDDPAILFFKNPLFKEINGRWFGYYGKLLNGGVWSEFVLSPNVKGLDAVFEQARSKMSVESPDVRFDDPDAEFAKSISRYLVGYDPANGKVGKVFLVTTKGGWQQYMVPSGRLPNTDN